MSYSVRHQVFVSSTFTDLKDERSEVIQAIWEMDCIPTGMEAFVASNESQWDVIKRVIVECDYYVLILGGRYGSITDDGISYTEKECRYAQQLGIPVLAFVHADPEAIPSGKSERTEESKLKLESFRTEIMAKYPVRSWSTAIELGGLVSRSLIREIKTNPRPGWIRNDGSSPIALLEKINRLTEENSKLREAADKSVQEHEVDHSLQQGADRIILEGSWRLGSVDKIGSHLADWKAAASWDDIFKDIGPLLINEATEESIQNALSRFHGWAKIPDGKESKPPFDISTECFNEVLIQLRALGLIAPGIKKRGVNDRNSYWGITQRGEKYLVRLLARRRPEPIADVPGL